MQVIKLVVDKKPKWCTECPLYNSSIKTIEKNQCGIYKDNVIDGAWRVGGMVPDERCLIQEVE